jgi:hypothetical protein
MYTRRHARGTARRKLYRGLLLLGASYLTVASYVLLTTPKFRRAGQQRVAHSSDDQLSAAARNAVDGKSASHSNLDQEVNSCQNRLTEPWVWWNGSLHDASPPKSVGNRYFVSSFPDKVTDGIGHMSSIVAWEMAASRLLRTTYVHRDAQYGSLKSEVDDFFNWGGDSENRTSFFDRVCRRVQHTFDPCRMPRVQCVALKRSIGGPSKIVLISSDMLHCAVKDQRPKSLAACGLTTFLERHSGEGILIQMDIAACFWKHYITWTGLEMERASTNYWLSPHSTFLMDARHVHVSVHVRRGDIIPSSQTDAKSKLVLKFPDKAIEKVITAVILGIEKKDGAMEPIYEIHIFSQGAKRSGISIWSNHRLDVYPGGYVNELGEEQGPEYWRALIHAALPSQSRRIHVTMHVSADTLTSIATMAASDVFIATKSALGNSLIRGIARGVQLQSVTEFGIPPNIVLSRRMHLGEVDTEAFAAAWKRYRERFSMCGKHEAGIGE